MRLEPAYFHFVITTRVPLEEKQTICAHAESMGESLNAFMRRAAAEAMDRDNASGKYDLK